MNLKRNYPLWLTLVFYGFLTFTLLMFALQKTDGHWGYPLDDTYIHMALAKNLVKDGIWGISQFGFSSSTSSILWTLLLSMTYQLFGVNDWAPFILCFLVGCFMIFYSHHLLKKSMKPVRLTLFLFFIVLFTPLPVMTLLGMEHILHGLLTIATIYCAATLLSSEKMDRRQFAFLLVLSGLVTLVRYEGLFLIFAVALLFIVAKRFSSALLIIGAGSLPILIYGIFSISQGSYFLPNSVLLKGNTLVFTFAGIYSFVMMFFIKLGGAPFVLLLMIALPLLVLWQEERMRLKEKYLIGIFTLMSLLHVQFASIGWFYRYEVYLLLTGFVIFADVLNSFIMDRAVKVNKTYSQLAVFILMLLFIVPFVNRSARSFQDYPLAVKNIFEQQYQMGLFVKKFYPQKTIAANDIGAINYLSSVKTLDLYGIGSIEVAQMKREGLLNQTTIHQLVRDHDVDIIMIYRSWFEGQIPSEWVEIGSWQITDNVICGDETVTFYSPNDKSKNELVAHLKEFSGQLPANIIQTGIYTTP